MTKVNIIILVAQTGKSYCRIIFFGSILLIKFYISGQFKALIVNISCSNTLDFDLTLMNE
jgi:hypothetical protein